MAMTMSAAVCRDRRVRIAAQVLFGLGVLVSSFAVYVLLKELLRVTPVSLGVLAAVVVWAGLRDVYTHVPVPYLNRQVPEWFRSVLPLPMTGASFGVLLGLGFATKFTYGAHMTFMCALALLAEPTQAIASLFAYAIARTLTAAVGPASASAGAVTQALHELRSRSWILTPTSIALSAALLIAAIPRLK